MQPAASPEERPAFPPHPLALALIQRLGGSGSSVLDFACASGRNSAALRRAGLRVVMVEDASAASAAPFAGLCGPFAAGLSTHGLLHGRAATIAENLRGIAALLAPGGLLYATFGSVRDARFGQGVRIDASTYAPEGGDERGVAHAFFDRDALETLLAAHFTLASLEERAVDEVAGSWAHHQRPLAGAVHWFAVATVSETTR
jgi:SAM-dependent methyltransferase